MMYVLFNHDGSVKRKNITEILQKGNSYVNKIFISIDGYEPSAYTFVAYCLLPDGTTTTMVSASATQVINGVSYNGVNITITQNETVYAGIIKINIRAVQNENVLVTYTLTLAINESVIESSDPIYMSVEQYENLLDIVLFKSSVLSTFTYTDNITSTVFNAQLDGQGFINFNLGDTTKVVLSADEALYRFSLKQDKLIAGTHITISDTQVIDVSNVESTLDEIEIEADVSGTLTEEQYATLIHNNFNTLNMDGEKFYLVYKDNEKMIFADYYITTAINWLSTIELTRATREWNLSRLNVSQVNEINDIKARVSALESANEYVATDITSLLNLGITHSASDIYKATMIQTQHQLIFEIKAKGTSNSIPTSDLLSDVISINSALGSKLRRFNNTLVSSSYAPSTPSDGRIGSGTFESYFDGNYAFNNIWLVSTAQNELRLYSPNVQQVSLEAKSISIDIRIVIDL